MKRVHADGMLRQMVMMVLGGYSKGYEAWDKMLSSFTNGLQLPGTVLDGRPVDEYYQLYRYADICLIPLVNSKFNRNKSNLKILEAANLGLPVVVSAVDPYLGFPDDLVNYVSNQTQWYKYIRHLVSDPSYRDAQGAALKEYCDNVYNFDKINEQRIELLKSLVHVES
jgi:glycosyltransferase involved in cell wall biosynthesis